MVQNIVARGGTPQQIAAFMQAHPGLQRDIVRFLQGTFGNSFVQTVISLLGSPDSQPAAAPALAAAPPPAEAKASSMPLGRVRVTATGLNVRSSPNAAAKDNIVGGLHHHTVVTAEAVQGEWLQIEYQGNTAFVHSDYVEPVSASKPGESSKGSASHTAASHTAPVAATPVTPVEHVPTPAAATPVAHAPVTPVEHVPTPVAATPVAATPIAATPHAPAPTTPHAPVAPTASTAHAPATPSTEIAHVAATPPAASDAPHADAKPSKQPKPKHHGSGFSMSGGGTVRETLTRLVEAGQLHLTGAQIAQLDAVAQVETGGQIGCVQTYDDQIVSVGFKQVVLGHGSLEKLMQKAPGGFAKHGLSLDLSKTYDHSGWSGHPHQIAGADDEEKLRTEDWGLKFYAASLEPDVIAAMCEMVLGDAGKVEASIKQAAPDTPLFEDATAQAWLLETYNNRPAFVAKAIKRAVDGGATTAANRDAFLDVLGHAIVDTYVVEEPKLFYNKAKHAHKGPLSPEQDAAMLAEAKQKYESVGRKKGTNIITKISRHLEIPKLHGGAEAKAPAKQQPPVIAVADHPVPTHDEVAAEVHTPTPEVHAPTPEVHAQTPVAHPQAPTPTPHVAEADKAPTSAKAPTSPTNPNNHVDAAADVFSAVYQAGAAGHTQYTQVYVSPGGLSTSTPDIFLFFHGHVAQYNIDPSQKQTDVAGVRTRLSGKDVAADAMTHARGKNTVCIMPQGVVGDHAHTGATDGTKEGGYMKAVVAGLPGFLTSVLGQLAHDLQTNHQLHDPQSTGVLTPGHISIAGHSAGGYEGISQALGHAGDLYDAISDVTLMDTGYGEPAHFRQTRDWMFQGKDGKNVRIIAQGGQLSDEKHGYLDSLGPKALKDYCDAHKAKGFTFEPLAWNDKPTKETRVMQHSRILKNGAPHAEVLVLKYWDETKDIHHNLRDHVIDDAVMSIGEGESSGGKDFGNERFGRYAHGALKDTYQVDGQPAPADGKPAPAAGKDIKAENHKADAGKADPKAAETKAADAKIDVHHDAAQTLAAGKLADPTKKPDAKHAGQKTDDHPGKPPAPSGAPQTSHEHKGYDSKNGMDTYGNATESTRAKNKHVPDANHRVFSNSFTTIAKAYLFTSAETENHLPQLLPVGTSLHVLKVTEHRAQIITPDITAEHNVWINFANLGGKPDAGAVVPFGNEATDAADKQRADAIRAGLPSVCKPGQSKHSWRFGNNFKPSWAGVALDGSLMQKVVALMNWAIANDMVRGDIVIGEGMRDPAHAHYMSVRYWIAKRNMENIDEKALAALPGGKDVNGTKWYDPKWSREEIIANAENEYKKNGGSGKVAAAGYNFGDPRRSPLILDHGQGVSAHCSGHAVDVDIPWRSEKDPDHGTDLWGWEQIYHQFGLTRPLHKDRTREPSMQESWHLEETGKSLNLADDKTE